MLGYAIGRWPYYIEVPDASIYYKGEDAPFQEFSPEHINFFGPDSLRNLMITNGFTPISFRTRYCGS